MDLNHRPLGYECHHQQSLKTMHGAESNALCSREAIRNPACPCVALTICPNSCVVVTAFVSAIVTCRGTSYGASVPRSLRCRGSASMSVLSLLDVIEAVHTKRQHGKFGGPMLVALPVTPLTFPSRESLLLRFLDTWLRRVVNFASER